MKKFLFIKCSKFLVKIKKRQNKGSLMCEGLALKNNREIYNEI